MLVQCIFRTYLYDSLKCRMSVRAFALELSYYYLTCNPATTSILRLFLILNEALNSNNNFIRNFRNRDGERRLYRPIFEKFLRRVPKPRHIGPQFAHYG